MARESISKKARFDVFKRDAFCCQYCGSTPPSAVLELDHIHPVSKGGTNSPDNLLTACFECNRGKSDRLLGVSPATIQAKAEIILEKREQLKAYERLLKRISKEQDRQVDELELMFKTSFEGKIFSEKFKRDIKNQFMTRLAFFQIRDAMEIATRKATRNGAEGACKYFCAVCWKFIRSDEV